MTITSVKLAKPIKPTVADQAMCRLLDLKDGSIVDQTTLLNIGKKVGLSAPSGKFTEANFKTMRESVANKILHRLVTLAEAAAKKINGIATPAAINSNIERQNLLWHLCKEVKLTLAALRDFIDVDAELGKAYNNKRKLADQPQNLSKKTVG